MKASYQIPNASPLQIVSAILCFLAALFQIVPIMNSFNAFGFDESAFQNIVLLLVAALFGVFVLAFGKRLKVLLVIPYGMLVLVFLINYISSLLYALEHLSFSSYSYDNAIFESIGYIFGNLFGMLLVLASFVFILLILLNKVPPFIGGIFAVVIGCFAAYGSLSTFLNILINFETFYFPWDLFMRLFLFTGIALYFFSFRKTMPIPQTAY